MSVELALSQSRTPAVPKNEYEMSIELVLPQSRTTAVVCLFVEAHLKNEEYKSCLANCLWPAR